MGNVLHGNGAVPAILWGVVWGAHVLAAPLCAAAAAAPAELNERSRAYLQSKARADHDRLIALAEESPDSIKALALFAAAMGDRSAKKYEEAAQHFSNAEAELGDLAHYAAYYRVQSLARAEKHASAALAAADFLQRFPQSRFAGLAAQLRAESLIRDERLEEARRFLESSSMTCRNPRGFMAWPASST